MAKKRKILQPKILVTAAIIVVLAVGGWLTYRHYHKNKPTPTTADGQPVNLDTATTEEKQQSQDAKDNIVNDQNNKPSTTSSGKKAVSVVITTANADQLTAYVTGVFEEGGSCTATFTQNSTTVTRTSTGFENASYTQCAPIAPNLPSGGSWSVTVSYSSGTAEGTSAAKTF